MQINAQRLREHLETLGRIGATKGQGVTRPALSPADLEAREQVKAWMIDAGMEVRLDAAANLIGRLPGRQTGPVIMMGSHTDTVPQGGIFDGALGVLAAVEVVHSLVEGGYQPEYPIEVAVFTDEEGTRFVKGCLGSLVVASAEHEMEALTKLKGHDGLMYGEVLEQLGLDPQKLGEARRAPESLKGYFELHIEQGGILEAEGLRIGVVEGIVGITRHWVTFRGKANHAGTTPMHLRKDALVGASELVLAVRETVHQLGGRLVGTVGFMEITPGGVNVVPGAVRMSIELRDMEASITTEATKRLAERAREIADRYGLTVEFREAPSIPGVPTDETMQAIIEDEAQALGLSAKRMISGAGHDAEHMATICPTGMIFVPSKGGISHSPAEWTEWDDAANGAQVLLNSVVRLDQR